MRSGCLNRHVDDFVFSGRALQREQSTGHIDTVEYRPDRFWIGEIFFSVNEQPGFMPEYGIGIGMPGGIGQARVYNLDDQIDPFDQVLNMLKRSTRSTCRVVARAGTRILLIRLLLRLPLFLAFSAARR